jgi:mutator protein MutT
MTARTPVVGAAILHAGKVLAARRTEPEHLKGLWEFPGGKVDVGETFDEALAREIHEELGVRIRVGDWLPLTVDIGERWQMRTALARIIEGEPQPHVHDAILWLALDDLDSVEWVEADQPFLAYVREALSGPLTRAILFDEESATEVAARLTRDGWTADLVRERYQGEDDEEDQPWAVVSDAPQILVEMLVEEFDGWLDLPEPPKVAPLVLPTAPQRIKRGDQTPQQP